METQTEISPVETSEDCNSDIDSNGAKASKMSMGKRLAIGFGFLAIVFALLVFLSLVFMPKDNTQEAGMIYKNTHGYLAEPEQTIDVAFIGDSEIYSGYAPLEVWKQYGIATVDIARAGQLCCDDLVELRDLLKTQTPKIVMVNLHSLNLACTALDAVTCAFAEIFPVVKYHEHWKNLTLRDLDFTTNYTYIDSYRGYYYNPAVNPIDPTAAKKQMVQGDGLPFINHFYATQIKALCDEYGVQLVIIGMPSYKNSDDTLHNAGVKLAAELGVEYIDFNENGTYGIDIDWQTDTPDYGDHLNYSGAVKLSTALGSYLQQTGLFTDKRNDERYTKWNEDMLAFEKSLAEGNVYQTWNGLE